MEFWCLRPDLFVLPSREIKRPRFIAELARFGMVAQLGVLAWHPLICIGSISA